MPISSSRPLQSLAIRRRVITQSIIRHADRLHIRRFASAKNRSQYQPLTKTSLERTRYYRVHRTDIF